jgi:hypothetical protein
MQHAANRVLQFFLFFAEPLARLAMHLVEVRAVLVEDLLYLILLRRVEL